MNNNEDDNEIVPEELDDSVVAEEHAQESIKKLREKLKESEAKAKEYLDGWQRAQADFANLRKRDEEAKNEFLKFAHADLVLQFLPVLDSLNMALSHGHKDVEPIYKQFLRVLKQNGLFCFLCKSIGDPICGQGTKIEKDMFELDGHIRHFFNDEYITDLLKNMFKILKVESGEENFYGKKSAYIKVIARR